MPRYEDVTVRVVSSRVRISAGTSVFVPAYDKGIIAWARIISLWGTRVLTQGLTLSQALVIPQLPLK